MKNKNQTFWKYLLIGCLLVFGENCESNQEYTRVAPPVEQPGPVIYGPAPTVSSVDPDVGYRNQETTLLIQGHDFQPEQIGTIVKLGEVKASSVEVLSSETIKAVFPAQTSVKLGLAMLTVENPGHRSVTRNDLFRFVRSFPMFWGEPSAGGDPLVVRLGDVDHDGVLDAITADASYPVWVDSYLMPTDGAFNPGIKAVEVTDLSWKNPDPKDYPGFRDLIPGDFNEDGLLDVVLSDPNQREIRLMWGDGTGRFPTWQRIELGQQPSTLAVADLNQDGHLDVLVADIGTYQLYVLMGQGKGMFDSAKASEAGEAPFSIKLWDINQDGKLDAVIANQNIGKVTVLLGDGQGGFTQKNQFKTCLEPGYVEVGDLDGDHHPDVVVSCPKDAGIQLIFTIDQESPLRTDWISIPGIPFGLLIEDFDGDGYPDIVVGNFSRGKYIHFVRNRWKQPGTFAPAEAQLAGWVDKYTRPSFVQAGDINGDGLLDIVANNFSGGSILVLLSNPLDK